jgi:hypothetical protein
MYKSESKDFNLGGEKTMTRILHELGTYDPAISFKMSQQMKY